jgi:hypothetical protein
MSPEQQFESIFQHLLMTHGPHSSLDVIGVIADRPRMAQVPVIVQPLRHHLD